MAFRSVGFEYTEMRDDPASQKMIALISSRIGNAMASRFVHLICASTLIFLASALNAQAGVAIVNRPIRAIDRRDYPHPQTLKIVFDLNSPSPSPGVVNPGMLAIANLIEQYGSYGFNSPRLMVVIVLHGDTTELALDAASSTKRTGATNGSIALMHSLAAKGVTFVVSRQALTDRGLDDKELQPIVKFGPSAEIIFLDFEANGYIFDGSKGLTKD